MLKFYKNIVCEQKTHIGSGGKIRQKLTSFAAEKGMGFFHLTVLC